MKIKHTIKTLYHTLTHFEVVNDSDYSELINSGFTEAEIHKQLNKPGSKFYSSFANSPKGVIELLQVKFAATFENAVFGNDNRCRLSFEFGESIGICSIVKESDLSEQEYKTIITMERNGNEIRTAKSNRIFPTNQCHLVLERYKESYFVCTIFPGTPAPPLPRKGQSDPFWDEHLFIESNI